MLLGVLYPIGFPWSNSPSSLLPPFAIERCRAELVGAARVAGSSPGMFGSNRACRMNARSCPCDRARALRPKCEASALEASRRRKPQSGWLGGERIPRSVARDRRSGVAGARRPLTSTSIAPQRDRTRVGPARSHGHAESRARQNQTNRLHLNRAPRDLKVVCHARTPPSRGRVERDGTTWHRWLWCVHVIA